MNSDLIALLSLFNQYDIKYLIVGGYAIAYHAEPRYTKDLDIWISTEKDNALKVYKALAEFGAPLKDMTPEDFEDETQYFMMGYEPCRVDILMGLPGLKFDESWRNREQADMKGLKLYYVSREDLIRNKQIVNREIDRRDVKKLKDSKKIRDEE